MNHSQALNKIQDELDRWANGQGNVETIHNICDLMDDAINEGLLVEDD